MSNLEDHVECVLEWSDRDRMYAPEFSLGLSREEYSRSRFPEVWWDIDRARAKIAVTKRGALYFEPYQQATGEFLEYVCGRSLT